MSRNPFSHIDLRVRSFANVTDFYRALLPELGFTMWWGEEGEWRGEHRPKNRFQARVSLASQRIRGISQTRPVSRFWVNTREEVDRVGEVVRRTGGQNIEGPALSSEYSEDYYAVFFEDPDGKRLEVVHRTR